MFLTHGLSGLQGEVLARLVVHATRPVEEPFPGPLPDPGTIANMTREEAVRALQQIAFMRK